MSSDGKILTRIKLCILMYAYDDGFEFPAFNDDTHSMVQHNMRHGGMQVELNTEITNTGVFLRIKGFTAKGVFGYERIFSLYDYRSFAESPNFIELVKHNYKKTLFDFEEGLVKYLND